MPTWEDAERFTHSCRVGEMDRRGSASRLCKSGQVPNPREQRFSHLRAGLTSIFLVKLTKKLCKLMPAKHLAWSMVI